jgi:hypothetical protein
VALADEPREAVHRVLVDLVEERSEFPYRN